MRTPAPEALLILSAWQRLLDLAEVVAEVADPVPAVDPMRATMVAMVALCLAMYQQLMPQAVAEPVVTAARVAMLGPSIPQGQQVKVAVVVAVELAAAQTQVAVVAV